MTRGNDVEVEFPLEIIQHIQSMIQYSSTKYTGVKEAARTSLVSKSWYRAWSMRPDLVFYRFNFPSSGGDLFWELAKTTLKRYEDHNLNIRSLRLMFDDDGGSLAKDLIVKAIELGVVDLTVRIVAMRSDDVNCFVKPDDDLESAIARFNLSGSASITINISLDRRREKGEDITCYNLKSLKLKNMASKDEFRDLMLRCPFIEECMGPLYDTELMDDEFLDKLLHQFPKLESLSLGIRRPTRHDLWAKFACLKELKIRYYGKDDDLRMRIPSLERISISGPQKVNMEFDFPNIRKFKLTGGLPRRFELKTSRDEWEAKICILYRIKSGPEWFSRLRKLVRKLSLSRSRVSLNIVTAVRDWDEFTFDPRCFGDDLPIHIPVVKKLTLRGCEAVPTSFLYALFWNCCPKFVKIQNGGFHGLDEVNVEVFKQLLLLPWKIFYNVSTEKYGYEVSFQLY